ncbi:MAG TPA: hypothetical protein VF581_02590, partial [Flavobacterium sp.]
MPNTRRSFHAGRMNKNVENRILLNGEYRHAENVIVLDSEDSSEGSVQNSLSNNQLTNIDFGANAKCIGAYSDESENKIYWFVKSDDGCYLLEWNNSNESVTIVLADTRPLNTRVLNLDYDHLITGIEKIISENTAEDLLLWTDDNIEPCCINIERAKTYGENNFEIEDIYLVKKPPVSAPTAMLTYSTGLENFIEEEFLSFSYRYKYLDGEYSALSDYANYNFVPGRFNLNYEAVENLAMINFFNAVYIGFNTGDKRVTEIQIVFKKSNSNNLYIVETFNKENEGWIHNQVQHFTFSNNKIYQVLPEHELSRAFDNVPLKAKALSLIGNRVVFGNYVEGQNLIDENGQLVRMDYNVSLISNSLTGSAIPYELTEDSEAEDSIELDFSGIALSSGSRISLVLTMEANYDEGVGNAFDGNFSGSVDFLLNRDYVSIAELAASDEFILFAVTILTNVFLQNYTASETPDNSTLSWVGFTLSTAGNKITLTAPVFTFTIDETPEDPEDNVTSTEIVSWTITSAIATFREFGVSSSLKTNRSYEVGIIYRDEFKRATTVLTTPNNTIYIPQSLSAFQNRFKIHVNHNPPAWAKDYKVVVKQNTLTYQTIYAVLFYEDGPYRWVRLDGANKDKAHEGDTLICKADLNGPLNEIIKVRVIEVKVQERNFLSLNTNEDGNEIIEEAGLYMKIRGTGISMDLSGNTYFTYSKLTINEPSKVGENEGTLYGYVPNGASDYVDYVIPAGARITLTFITSTILIAGDAVFHESFISSAEHANFQDWFEAEISGLGEHANHFIVAFERNPDNNALYLVLNKHPEFGGPIYNLSGRVVIQSTAALVIFETEPKQAENETFYETAQAFLIEDGLHKGNLQDQNDNPVALPAIIDLDFFNCYSMGNGAESYRIKDVLNKNSLNIDLRPSATSIEGYKQIRRYADLTYSEPFIESTNLNGLNVFNLSTANYKELDKQYGSIQKLHSRNYDIGVFQEEKAFKVLFSKDALTNADGSENLISTSEVLGRAIPYLGENGIGKNPESFAVNGYQIYFVNKTRGEVVRLSMDGATDISGGLSNYFRDLFRRKGNANMIGGYDPYLNQYVLSVGEEPVKVYTLECGQMISRFNKSEVFSYTLNLNGMTGEIIINYDITGVATIACTYNTTTVTGTESSGSGSITIPRPDLSSSSLTVAITPIGGPASYTLA